MNEEQIDAVRHHLDEVIQGAAFKGSHRSRQFLRYIVEKTLVGDIEGLKERTIGVELFQRSPSYDTGQDAIVRVTASDVRRRLLEHYGRYGDASEFHFHLPRGSYIPEIEMLHEPAQHGETQEAHAEGQAEPGSEENGSPQQVVPPAKRRRWWIGAGIAAAACLGLVLAMVGLRHSAGAKSTTALPPWTEIFKPGQGAQIVTSDPNLEKLEELTRSNISVSDYVNHRFIPAGIALTPDQQSFYEFYLHANNAAAVDTPLAVNIARLAPRDFPLQIHSARSLHIADFENNNNLILIGSPRSNPWVEMFQEQLDFRFVFGLALDQEIVQNVNPRGHEQAQYLPTARGFATGESFALVALVHKRNRTGRVLLLAGVSEEGTEAAGHMVTDRDHLVRLLDYCGISSNGPVQDFEALLQLRMLAGSPSITNLVACHLFEGHNPS